MIIDLRLRPPIPAWTDSGAFDSAMFYAIYPGFEPAPSAAERSLELLLQEMDEAGIVTGVIMGRKASFGNVSNEGVKQFLEQYPKKFVGFIGIDLTDIPGGVKEIERYGKFDGFKGVSIEPGSAETPLRSDDPSLFPIYEACLKYNLPISISLSSTLSGLSGQDIDWARPVSIAQVAKKFPDLKIIVSHAAWPYAEEMVAVAIISPNVYVSPDIYIAVPGMLASQAYIDGANLFLEDRTLFGTAYPSLSLKKGVEGFHSHAWRKEIISKILYENAAKLLNL